MIVFLLLFVLFAFLPHHSGSAATTANTPCDFGGVEAAAALQFSYLRRFRMHDGQTKTLMFTFEAPIDCGHPNIALRTFVPRADRRSTVVTVTRLHLDSWHLSCTASLQFDGGRVQTMAPAMLFGNLFNGVPIPADLERAAGANSWAAQMKRKIDANGDRLAQSVDRHWQELARGWREEACHRVDSVPFLGLARDKWARASTAGGGSLLSRAQRHQLSSQSLSPKRLLEPIQQHTRVPFRGQPAAEGQLGEEVPMALFRLKGPDGLVQREIVL